MDAVLSITYATVPLHWHTTHYHCHHFKFLNLHNGGWSQLSPPGTAATNRPIVPAPCDYDDGEIAGMMIGRGNRSTLKKPAPLPFFPQQILYDLSWDRTQAATVGSQHLIYLSYGTALNNLFTFSLF